MAAPRRSSLIVIVFVVVVALIAGVSVVAWRAGNLATQLSGIVTAASALQKDAQAGDLAAVGSDIHDLDDAAQNALVAAGDPVLTAVDGLPVAGPYLRAVRSITQATAGLTSAAQPMANLLPELAPDKLVVNGQYNVATLTKLQPVLTALTAQLSVSQKQIASIDHDGLDGHVVNALTSLGSAFASADSLLTSAEPLLGILPIVLANDQPRTWFVSLQNLDEARGTGGILSAYAVLHIDHGKITLEKTASDKDILEGAAFDGTEGLPDDFIAAYQQFLLDWRDVNQSPHFPYTGELFRNGWKNRTGETVDGVLALGQGIVQYLLAATGPVTVDGETLDASNITDFLSLGQYQKYPDASQKDVRDALAAQLVASIFQKFSSGQFSLDSIIKATGMKTTGDRLLAWSSHDDTQKQIETAGLAGEIPDTYGPVAAVAINNGGANKLEQFLHTSIDYSLGACGVDDGSSTYSRKGSITITLDNQAPSSGLPAYVTPRGDLVEGQPKPPVGANSEFVTVYLPVGALESDYELDGQPTDAAGGTDRGRDILTFIIELNPAQKSTLVVHWDEPTVGDDVVDLLGSTPSVITQPSLNPISVTAPAATACDVSN